MTDQTPSELLNIVRQFRAALERHDAAAMKRLTRAYTLLYSRLKDKIDLLIDQIALEEPTLGQVMRMARYNSLIRQVRSELEDFQVILRNEIDQQSRDAIGYASRDTVRMLRAMAQEYGVAVQFNKLPSDAIRTLLGFLDPDGPLYARIGELAKANAQTVAEKILEGVGLGYNPNKLAGLIREYLGGGLTDALRMTRTVQLWTYREATRANYINNSDVVEGWVWWAQLDDVTCEVCTAEHGTVHGLDENLDGHYNCRCAMIPVVTGFPSPVEQTGVDWFDNLTEAQQRDKLGPGKYEAWKDGKFTLPDLIDHRPDDVYGYMVAARPLKDFEGEE